MPLDENYYRNLITKRMYTQLSQTIFELRSKDVPEDIFVIADGSCRLLNDASGTFEYDVT